MLQKTDVTGGIYGAEHHLAAGVQANSHRTGWQAVNFSDSSRKSHVSQYP